MADNSGLSPSKVKCDFCDRVFNCDLDVSRHLFSHSHRTNRENFISLCRAEETIVEKDIPKNLTQVFKALNIRTVKDLTDLADKGYFKADDEDTVEIASKLAKVLLVSLVVYNTRNLPESVRDIFLQKLKEADNESTRNDKKSPVKERPSPDPSVPRATPNTQPTPATSTSQAARASVSQVNRQTSQAQSVPRVPKVSQKAQAPKATKPVQASHVQPATKPTEVPQPSQAPRNRPRPLSKQVPHSAGVSPPQQRQAPNPRSRPNIPITSSAEPLATPNPHRVSKSTAPPPSKQNPPSVSDSDRDHTTKKCNLTPQQGSTYVPQLAIIKIEPKDD